MEAAISARSTNQRRAAERNDIRQAIRELFPARRCRTLVRPAVDEESIRQAVKLEDAQLRPEFVKQMGTVRDELLAAAPVKSLYGSALDGSMLATLAQSYLDAMNAPGALPCIRSAWEFVVEERCRAAGMDDYIAKPVDRTGLNEIIQRWLPQAAGARRPRGRSSTISRRQPGTLERSSREAAKLKYLNSFLFDRRSSS